MNTRGENIGFRLTQELMIKKIELNERRGDVSGKKSLIFGDYRQQNIRQIFTVQSILKDINLSEKIMKFNKL